MRLLILSLIASCCIISNAIASIRCPSPQDVQRVLKAAGSDEISPRFFNKDAIRADLAANLMPLPKNIKMSSLIIRAKLLKGPWTVKETIYENTKVVKCVYLSGEGGLPVLEITGDL